MKWSLILSLVICPFVHSQDVPYFPTSTKNDQDLGAINSNFTDLSKKNIDRTSFISDQPISSLSCTALQTIVSPEISAGILTGGTCSSISPIYTATITATAPILGDGGTSTPIYLDTTANYLMNNLTLTSTMTVKGNAFSVGGSTIDVRSGRLGIGKIPTVALDVNGDFITKGPYADVRAFGAKGDSSTDDTTSIQAAINSMTNGGTVYFPPGTYIVSALTMPNVSGKSIRLLGAGSWTFSGSEPLGTTILKSNSISAMITPVSSSDGNMVENIVLYGSGLGTYGWNGIYGAREVFKNVFVGSFTVAGINLQGGLNQVLDSVITGNGGDGLQMAGDGRVSGNYISSNGGYGLKSVGTGIGGTFISHNEIAFNNAGGVNVDMGATSVGNIEISGCYIEDNGISTTTGSTIHQIYIKGQSATSYTATNIRISNNYISTIHVPNGILGNMIHIEDSRQIQITGQNLIGSDGVNTTEGYGIYLSSVDIVNVSDITGIHIYRNVIHGEGITGGAFSNINIRDCAYIGTSANDAYGIYLSFVSGSYGVISNITMNDYRGASGYLKGLYATGSALVFNHHYNGPNWWTDTIPEGMYFNAQGNFVSASEITRSNGQTLTASFDMKSSTGTCTLPNFPIILSSGNLVCQQPSNVSGSAASITGTLNAGQLTAGPIASSMMVSTVAYSSVDNNWSVPQTFQSSVTVKAAGGAAVTYVLSAGSATIGTTDLVTDAANHRVGIGTASPGTTFDVNGNVQFGSGITKSTFTSTGYWIPRTLPLATIRGLTPSASEIGGHIGCSDCAVPYSVCIATGATIQGFRLEGPTLAECK